MNKKKLQWWGYEHCDGTIIIKRYFTIRDIEEAVESDFVVQTWGPTDAETREEAKEIFLKRLLRKKRKI